MGKVKILLLDDLEINLDLLESMLGLMDNYDIYKFDSPKNALEWCKGNTPDIAIIDYMMPEMTGIQWAVEFRKIKSEDEIPIIMITAYDEKDVKYQALEAGINDFLPKPFDRIELMARIRNMQRIREYAVSLSDRAKWLESEIKKALSDILDRENEIIFRLAKASEFRDEDTYNHIWRMSNYAYHIALNLGMDEKDAEMILKAAPMHDVGKIGIPDTILFKPGKLDESEFEIIKKHCFIGYKILSGSSIPLLELSAEIAYTHHEKFDGSGYPRGLRKEEIPLSGRICAVADVFDALTSKRPYKKEWDVEEAVYFLESKAGSHFDPDCVKAFLANFENVMRIKEKYQD